MSTDFNHINCEGYLSHLAIWPIIFQIKRDLDLKSKVICIASYTTEKS